MYDAINLCEVAESEPYTLYGFLSNKIEIILSYEEVWVKHFTIPAEWIYYLGVCKIRAEDGEVFFMLIEDDEDPTLFKIAFVQNGRPPSLMNLISRNVAEHQALWLLRG